MTAVPFSIMWAGFAFFWEWGVIHSKAPLFFRLWGIPFVVVGCHMLVGRFFADAWERARTHYALTNQRVIVSIEGRKASVRSFDLRTLNDTSLKLKEDGSGTIDLGPAAYRTEPPALEMLDDAASVYDRIRRAQQDVPLRPAAPPLA
jgi:hypothetical protein